MNKKILLSVIFSLLLCAIKIPATAQQPSLNIAPSATQNKISLDVKGMDIVDVLKMLATRSGMNIVIGKNVAGKVTLFLKDVDTQDAFEIILLANGLAYDKQENIVNIMTAKDYELLYGAPFKDKKQARIVKLNYAKAVDLARSLNQFKTNAGRIIVDDGSNTLAIIDVPEVTKAMEDFISQTDTPLETKIFDLNYAQAEKLNTKLQEILTKNVGRIKIDERTNKMVVTDYPAKVKEMTEIIEAFDEKNLQVLIDAQIINLTPSDQFQMGVDWDYWIKKYFDLKVALPVNPVTAGAMFIGTTKVTSAPNKPGQYKAVIDILRTIGDTKVLSSPRIITLNNQEAKIHVGTRDAYITSTISQSGTGTAVTSQSVNFVDVGIQLHVTPTINKDGFVTMKIKPELSDATRTDLTSEGQITQVPIVSTSESESTVMVKDGVTIIIGGLRKDKRTKTVKKIPVLGDIPGLGMIFRSTDDKTEVNELIILLTPHIMTGEKSYSDFSELPPNDGVVVKMEKGNIVINKTSGTPDPEPEYHRSIINKIKTIALFNQPNGKKEKGEVKLNFTLSKDGTLIGEPIVLETNNSALSLPALVAVKSSAPFSPFPEQMQKDKETFSISLAYE
ncbi:MAG: secretin N-terminal domain-containing protein [Candidatus Omnitrophota bacterium]|nr:secretin N-terminal domain-containing protein [Candidatus Omnitrophota bacterium]